MIEEWLEKIQERRHLIQNGQHETLANSPRVYCEHMQELIKSKCVARSSDITKEISDYINKGTEKKALLLPKAAYTKYTPQNKVALWGAAFATWIEFFKEHLERPRTAKPKIIWPNEYNKIPKRYRNAIKPVEHIYLMPVEQVESPKLFLRFKDAAALKQFKRLMAEAERLLPLVYTETAIYTIWGNGDEIEKRGYGAQPSTKNESQQQQVSDEQLIAINRLKSLFAQMSDLVYFIKKQSNAWATIAEYTESQKNKDMILKAQRYLRTVKQEVVSAKKNADVIGKDTVHQAEINL